MQDELKFKDARLSAIHEDLEHVSTRFSELQAEKLMNTATIANLQKDINANFNVIIELHQRSDSLEKELQKAFELHETTLQSSRETDLKYQTTIKNPEAEVER